MPTLDADSFSSYDADIQLVQGQFPSSGYLEVSINNNWGPVCNMEKYDADSACRQLGYTNAVSVISQGD